MRRMMFVLAMGFLFATPLFAQVPPRLPGEEPQFIFYEAVNLFANDLSMSRVDIHYRIDEDFFIALKNSEPSFPWQFKRRGEILIELLDSTGVSAARNINRIELGTNSAESSDSAATWYRRIVSFDVRPGLYTIAIEISDLESERRFLDRSRELRAQAFLGDKLVASSPVFLFPGEDSEPETPTIHTPQFFGGNVLYGSKGFLFVEVLSRSQDQKEVLVQYSIKEQRPPDDDTDTNAPETISVSPAVRFQPELTPNPQGNTYTIRSGAGPGKSYGVILPLPLEKLPLRRFELSALISVGSDTVRITKKFRTIWPDMPLSLKNIDLAFSSLRFITEKDQLDSIRGGSFETRLNNLEAFWKDKDKTPETAFNEVMAEYYRRVDYAMKNFSTLKESDGSKNDRGRVYILHGPPTKTERNLNASAGYQEVWTYERLKKKFIFADETKSGSYVLVSTQHL